MNNIKSEPIKSYIFTFEGYEDYSIYGFRAIDYQSALDKLYKKFPKAVNVEGIEYNDI